MAALALGIVKPEDAFTGFSDDIVIIVGSALVISAAVQRSGLIEEALALVMRRVTRVRSHLFVLMASVGFASALVKNVGALAMLMPAAFQLAKKDKVNASVFLMPMAFASLLRSEEHTSELQSLMRISYAVFCLKPKKTQQ